MEGGLLVGIIYITEVNVETLRRAYGEEQLHTWVFYTARVRLHQLTQPRGGPLGTIETDPGFTLPVGLDDACPLSSKDLTGAAGVKLGNGNDLADGSGLPVGLQLRIIGVEPLVPV